MNLVYISVLIPDMILDLRYATTKNVTGSVLYTESEQLIPMVGSAVAKSLVQAAESLRKQSLRLVVWDAYRPESVQTKLIAAEPDTRYVNAKSNHCLGKAVDVTLANIQGDYLDMGTDFDDFSPRAHSDFIDLTPTQIANREILKQTMESAGFKQWPYEWWHFDYLVEA